MAENKIIGLRRSEVLRIEAAIVEIMGNAKFSVSEDVSLQKRPGDGYKMCFKKDKAVLSELLETQKKLGDNITITVLPCDKKNLEVSLEASTSEFSSFLKRREETLA